jgi:hypothetical protein
MTNRPDGSIIPSFGLPAMGACFLACAWLAGCASPGEPTPPRPIIPVAVTDLAARQSGNSVLLTFTVPRRSTDREQLIELPTLEIYRAVLPSGGPPDKQTLWRLAYTILSERLDSYLNGETVTFRDPLAPEDLARAPGSPLSYKVRARASRRAVSAD